MGAVIDGRIAGEWEYATGKEECPADIYIGDACQAFVGNVTLHDRNHYRQRCHLATRQIPLYLLP